MLIRNANSVEALARLNVVCFDKTGTLSENRLQVKQVQPIRGRHRDDVVTAALATVFARNGRADHATDDAIRRAAGDADALLARRLPAVPVRTAVRRRAGRRPADDQGRTEVLSAALNGNRDRLAPAVARLAAKGCGCWRSPSAR